MTEVPKRIAVLMGTRPECIKLAPVVAELEVRDGVEPTVINTGQHREMLNDLLMPLGVRVDRDMAVMQPGQELAILTARLLEGIDKVLTELQPAFALAQGDTTTVLAAALACFYRGVPFGHVEAGLRTGDLRAPFPEEGNRLLAAQLATLHFAPTERARSHLLREGIPDDRIVVTGNTGIDALLTESRRQRDPSIAATVDESLTARLGAGWQGQPTVVVTAHRRESFGAGIESICEALADLARLFPAVCFVFPLHANPNVRGPARARLVGIPNVRLLDPLPHAEMVSLQSRCRLVLTDSGGMQEEAPALGKPVVVMRERTERPEGVIHGVARLVGLSRGEIVEAVSTILGDPESSKVPVEARNLYGTGDAAKHIVEHVERFLNTRGTASTVG